jgi:hypothetical protein
MMTNRGNLLAGGPTWGAKAARLEYMLFDIDYNHTCDRGKMMTKDRHLIAQI